MSNYFKPVIEDRFDRAARLIKEARSSKESSAPLDPSKVKAGDTVTLKIHDPEMAPFEVQGPAYDGPEGVMAGAWPLVDHPHVTLTAHQPAAEPEPEWKPGTVAVVVQGGDPGAGVDDHEFRAALQTDGMWVGLAGEAATSAPVSVRPLVVIDPAAVDWPALQGKISQRIPGERPFAVALGIIGIVAEALGIEATS